MSRRRAGGAVALAWSRTMPQSRSPQPLLEAGIGWHRGVVGLQEFCELGGVETIRRVDVPAPHAVALRGRLDARRTVANDLAALERFGR